MISLFWLGTGQKKMDFAFYSKILVRIKNMRRKHKSSALMDAGSCPAGFGNCFPCRYTQQNFYCRFFEDRMKKSLAPIPISRFCKPKAFVGMSKG